MGFLSAALPSWAYLLVYVTTFAFNLLYQFWIHTETINKLGWFEYVFNTPSHHRVHHGTNPKYIDKNYAGIFIIWDRMFSTFQEEEETPLYGTLKPLQLEPGMGKRLSLGKSRHSECAHSPRLRIRSGCGLRRRMDTRRIASIQHAFNGPDRAYKVRISTDLGTGIS